MLSRLALMVQAAVLDGPVFDPVPPFDDGGVAAEVGVGGRDVAETLVVAVVLTTVRRICGKARGNQMPGPPRFRQAPAARGPQKVERTFVKRPLAMPGRFFMGC